ncbi:toxin Doc [Streptomyces sp. NPDC058457]|uniref:toxin Doc n=1 Tax=Streptomyces sp. NPDC058457 TaxID=3346507 RepID=UPI00365E6106
MPSLYIGVCWLLDVRESVLGYDDLAVADCSALVAAVAGRRTRMPAFATADPDAVWRAAALLHTIVRVEPLPYCSSLYAAFFAAQYVAQAGVGVDPPCGALSGLVGRVRDTRVSVRDVADQLRGWKL